MKRFLMLSLVCVVGLFFLAGCGAMQLGSKKFPEPTASFQPQGTYNVTYEKIWETTKDVLDDNGIFIASSDKNEGRITTEYVEGQSQANALGFLGVISTRYRYFIIVEKKATTTQRVRITARLESSGDALQQWRDISSDNKAITTKLENWLYEQIEKSL